MWTRATFVKDYGTFWSRVAGSSSVRVSRSAAVSPPSPVTSVYYEPSKSTNSSFYPVTTSATTSATTTTSTTTSVSTGSTTPFVATNSWKFTTLVKIHSKDALEFDLNLSKVMHEMFPFG